VVELSSETPDVPNGDCFRTINVYTLVALGPKQCRLSITGHVSFFKASWIRGFIENHAVEGYEQFLGDLHKFILETIAQAAPSARALSPTPPTGAPATSAAAPLPTPLPTPEPPPEPEKPSLFFYLLSPLSLPMIHIHHAPIQLSILTREDIRP